MNKFCVITAVYNAKDFIERCIMSVLSQTYRNFTYTVIDDCSTDGTSDIIKELHEQNATNNNFNFYRNEIRVTSPLANFVKGIELSPGDREDIIVTVDGDDWLAHENVFVKLDEIYQDPDVWLTYGSFLSASGKLDDYCHPITDTRNYRKTTRTTGHLRTLKRKLFNKIDKNDLRKADGDYYNKYNDTAYMYPAVEMAGTKHIRLIPDILYIYNDQNPLCSIYDFENAFLNADWGMDEEIRNKKQYDELTEL
jgi:glycosyltransferase involved in cell wall biosynthesis